MSRPYGPVALTAGVASSVSIDASAAWATIENSSLNLDLGVSFQVNKPPVVATFSGAPYSGVIQAGAAKRFELPVADGSWTGVIWLLPLSVASQSAQTGAASTYSRAYVTSYNAYEEPTDNPVGVIRGLDLTSEPRVVTVPIVAEAYIGGVFTTPSTPNSAVPAGLINMNTFTLGIPSTTTRANGYFHSLYARAGTTGQCRGTVYIWAADAALTPLAFGFIAGMRFFASRAGQYGPSEGSALQFVNPIFRTANIPANTASLIVFYTLDAGDGGMEIEIDGSITIDTRNFNPPSYIGGTPINTPGDLY